MRGPVVVTCTLALQALYADASAVEPGVATAQGGADTVVRCASPPATPEARSLDRKRMSQFRALNLSFDKLAPTFEVPVQFHIVMDGDGTGDVSDDVIDAQLRVLNDAYQSLGFTFWLKGTDRKKHSAWHRAKIASSQEREMKQRLKVSPDSVLNVYVLEPPGYLGWATYPWDLATHPAYDGVVLKWTSFPNAPPTPLGQGDTAVHEVGHWLGLLHTFENGCVSPGDEVDDTPDEAEKAEGTCVKHANRDSCPTAGLDPIKNYLDYGDDDCMSEFTQRQAARMREETAMYRSALASKALRPQLKGLPLQ